MTTDKGSTSKRTKETGDRIKSETQPTRTVTTIPAAVAGQPGSGRRFKHTIACMNRSKPTRAVPGALLTRAVEVCKRPTTRTERIPKESESSIMMQTFDSRGGNQDR